MLGGTVSDATGLLVLTPHHVGIGEFSSVAIEVEGRLRGVYGGDGVNLFLCCERGSPAALDLPGGATLPPADALIGDVTHYCIQKITFEYDVEHCTTTVRSGDVCNFTSSLAPVRIEWPFLFTECGARYIFEAGDAAARGGGSA